MKIGFIGGIKHGKERNALTGHDKTELEWEVKAELPMKQPGFQTHVRTFVSYPEHQIYNLKIIKKNGELKYFYVAQDLSREEIESALEDCWELSDNLGYEFD
jgi:hypothetical protein